MKISYYELLGMIKENKQPNKVVYNDNVYIWNERNYKNSSGNYLSNIIDEINMFDKNIIILEPTEIIEEDKEIEELQLCSLNKFKTMSSDERYYITAIEYDKLNEVIRKVNKIEKEGK